VTGGGAAGGSGVHDSDTGGSSGSGGAGGRASISYTSGPVKGQAISVIVGAGGVGNPYNGGAGRVVISWS
jgi:hypothetical protein